MTLSPCSDSLSLGLRRKILNPATSYKSPAHSSTGTRSDILYPPTACQLTVSCSFSLPYGGSISPFHRCTSSLSVTQEYLALRGGPRRFTRDSTCPILLGIFPVKNWAVALACCQGIAQASAMQGKCIVNNISEL